MIFLIPIKKDFHSKNILNTDIRNTHKNPQLKEKSACEKLMRRRT